VRIADRMLGGCRSVTAWERSFNRLAVRDLAKHKNCFVTPAQIHLLVAVDDNPRARHRLVAERRVMRAEIVLPKAFRARETQRSDVLLLTNVQFVVAKRIGASGGGYS